jgi:next to BRCA1 gene 1 protein
LILERYSDSAGAYITLDSSNASVYKQLYRAAKAKLKLRIKATVIDAPKVENEEPEVPDPVAPTNLEAASVSDCSIATAVAPTAPPSEVPPAADSASLLEHLCLVQRHRLDALQQAREVSCQQSTQPTVVKPDPPAKVEHGLDDEAPVPHPFADRENVCSNMAEANHPAAPATPPFDLSGHHFTVCCNECNRTIPDIHWHCGICDDGDYDLCGHCVSKGLHCGVEGHFLIKRTIENGKVLSSTTVTLHKRIGKTDTRENVGSLTDEPKEQPKGEAESGYSRTCNSCIEGEKKKPPQPRPFYP